MSLSRCSVFALLATALLALSSVTNASDSLTREQLAERIKAGETSESPLFMTPSERRIVFANTDYFSPVRRVEAGSNVYALTPAPRDLGAVQYEIDGQMYTIESFLGRHPLMGLVVVQDDKILLEHYADDHSAETRWISFSVTKSVTSMLMGAAVEEGYIGSLEDTVGSYLPRLAGSDYGNVRVRDILQMASGIEWDEDYTDPESDVSRAGILNGVELTTYLAKLPKLHEPGTVFNYNTGESNLTGEVLRAAIGNNAATYLTHKIWQPFGMEHDATWVTDGLGGGETGGCCISATLRDYARLGLFALADGVLPSGERVLPAGWMTASTAPSEGADFYGYLWWLAGDDRFNASGIFGQKIFVDPQSKLVIAAHSNAETATGSDYAKHLQAALLALSDHLRVES